MNTGQSLLSIGALLLLSLTILRVNNGILSSDTVLQNSKIGVLATSLGTSLIEEANRKSFDAASVGEAIIDKKMLTPPYLLGPDGGETPDTYNDFDDYNGYVKADTVFNIDLRMACKINYVEPNNVDGIKFAKTWHKKITVSISSSFISDTLLFSSVYSYWHFR
jgi:MSHA pilin protein MshD